MNHPRVLIVDDDLDMLETLRGELSIENWEVQVAWNGQQALDILRAQKFEVIVSDVVMPGIDGLNLLKEVRKLDRDAIFVLMSGFHDVPIWDCFASGATEVFGKPFRFYNLDRLVQRMRLPMWERWGNAGKSLGIDKVMNHIEVTHDKDNHWLSLGRGGIFVAPDFIGRVSRGDIVSFRVRSPQLFLEGIGKVQWRRYSSSGLAAGIGIEFLFLEDSCRRAIIRAIEISKAQAMIPVGQGIKNRG